MTELELNTHTIDIWLIEPQRVDEATMRLFQSVITPVELANANRKRGSIGQRDAIITRAFIRQVLSQYEDISPLAWEFGKGFNGKPFISQPNTNLSFNLSHAKDLIVCAVSRGCDLGIDVEYIKRKSDTYKLAPRYFSPQEISDLQALPYHQQAIDFYHYWTLKEAYIKACGDGLAIPLNQFSFKLTAGEPVSISFAPARDDHPNYWQHFLYQPTDAHKMALSVKVANHLPLSIRMLELQADNSFKATSLPLK